MELHIRIIEATDLAKMDIVGLSDPYVKIKIHGTNQKDQTTIIKDSVNPVWNQDFHFSAHNPNKQVLVLKMMDKDVTFDDEMATLQIPLAALNAGKVKDQWFEMIPCGRASKGGKIHLLIQLNYFGLPPFIESPVSLPPPNCVLNLKIIEAKDVPKMDVTKSDPYITIDLDGKKEKTKAIKGSLTPKWDETFTLAIAQPETAVLTLSLWDEDKFKDDLISKLEFGIGYLPFGYTVDNWFTMENTCGSKRKGGILHIAIQLAGVDQPPFQH